MNTRNYDRASAINYAQKWALSRNPRYYNFDAVGGDCTSFVSQCLFAGSKKMCIIICILQMITLIFTWSGWISLLPVAANIAATIGGYTHNARKIRIVGMVVNSPLWIIYGKR